MNGHKSLSRRQVIRAGLLGVMAGAGAAALAACGETQVVTKEIIKEVQVETVVTKEVVREVPVETVVTREVVKEVPVERLVTTEVVKQIVQEVEVPTELGTVEVITPWGGAELEAFEAIVKPWEEATGGKVAHEQSPDMFATMTARTEGGHPPDVAVLFGIGHASQLARDGHLVPLETFLNMAEFAEQYSPAFIDMSSVDGTVYGVHMYLYMRGLVWYSPSRFKAEGLEVPTTWDEMIDLSDRIVAQGGTPWGMGTEHDVHSGWQGSDFIQEYVLADQGPQIYDAWGAHEIPWTDPRIKREWERWGEIALNPDYVFGGVDTILSTRWSDAAVLPFMDPPRAYLHQMGSFVFGTIADRFPELRPGEDFSVFRYPTINPQFEGASSGGSGVMVTLTDRPETASFIRYITSTGTQQLWASTGGFLSSNRLIPLDAYSNPVNREIARIFQEAKIYRHGNDNTWGAPLQPKFFESSIKYLRNPDSLDDILADFDSVVESL